MNKQTVFRAKKAIVVKYTYTKGPDIGDFFYIVTDRQGNFIDRFGNRSLKEAINKATA